MDTFFGNLLAQKDYAQLLKDHLEGYVREIVNKKVSYFKDIGQLLLFIRRT